MNLAADMGHHSGRATPSLHDAPYRQFKEAPGRRSTYPLPIPVQTNPATSVALTLTCADLSSKYDTLEYVWAATHTLNVGMLKADRKFLESFGTGAHPLLYDAQVSVEKSQRVVHDEDVEYALKADRVITLMGANKCKAPDHVASWFTYSNDNPNKRTYVAR